MKYCIPIYFFEVYDEYIFFTVPYVSEIGKIYFYFRRAFI